MIAILLCAGFSTRLQPLTSETPGALLDVAGRPVLDYLVDQLAAFPSLEAIHLVTNSRFIAPFYTWRRQRQAAGDGGPRLVLHHNGAADNAHRRGEVGDLAFALAQPEVARTVADEGALVASGDTLYRFALRPLWDRFREEGSNLVMAFPEAHPLLLQQRSVVAFDADYRLQAVYEQPEAPPTDWIMPPFYLLQPAALAHAAEYLEEGGNPEPLGTFIHDLAGRFPITVAPQADRDLRLRINTYFMYEYAQDLLGQMPLMAEDEALVP